MAENGKKEKIENPNAFPSHYEFDDGSYASQSGMTLRDYFAAKAMQVFLLEYFKPVGSTIIKHEINNLAGHSKMAYEMADAMLKVRNNSSAD